MYLPVKIVIDDFDHQNRQFWTTKLTIFGDGFGGPQGPNRELVWPPYGPAGSRVGPKKIGQKLT